MSKRIKNYNICYKHQVISDGKYYVNIILKKPKNCLLKLSCNMIVPKKSTEDDLAEVVVKDEAKNTVKNVGYRPARQVPMMPQNNNVAQQQPPPRRR